MGYFGKAGFISFSFLLHEIRSIYLKDQIFSFTFCLGASDSQYLIELLSPDELSLVLLFSCDCIDVNILG